MNTIRLSSIIYTSLILSKRKFTHNITNYCLSKVTRMSPVRSIADLGYAFNAGQLRKVNDNGEPGEEPFQFNISNDHQECQAHYEVLGAAVTEHVYHLLESQENLIKLPIPKGSTEKNGTFIFVSQDYDKKDVLMVLIHGSGVVRAGQWARSLIINDCIESGTQIPYIRQAKAREYGIMVLNSNDNYREDKRIPHTGSSEEHVKYVWDEYIPNTKASSIVIVAHSYGGILTVGLADKQKKQFEKRVKAVALTDSVHSYSGIKISKHLLKVSRNWIASSSPLDTPMKTPSSDIYRVSAGHPKHEMTSSKCIDSVFKYFEGILKEHNDK
ncbi:FAM172 family protein homolog CG10038 isoform X2 [Nymphalis io]|uniref:FAM172 family protein homolog CG10038 isoform X2 n=1 Tax=Inachis io TaxID=171585 RepID=UPI0021674554|nr:FAM172 family protein homolog CG10038 isoform X2 [Nymphalis io]